MSGAEPTGYEGIPPLDMNKLTPADVAAAFPQLTTEQSQAWELALAAIRDQTQQAVDARTRVANVLTTVQGLLGIVGRVMTITAVV